MKKVVLILSMMVLLSACAPSQYAMQSTVDAAVNPHPPTIAIYTRLPPPTPTITLHPLIEPTATATPEITDTPIGWSLIKYWLALID